MDYQSTDEVIRREACKQVQQIANAIIKIRKKYYLCFSKISATDQKRYDDLKIQMQKVANENGLEKLNVQLMSEIETQFGEDMPNDTDENGNPTNGTMENLHQKFINAVAMQAELTLLARKVMDTDLKLASAYIKKAKMCQKRAKEYEELLVEQYYSKFRLSCDRLTVFRDKFGELSKGKNSELYENCRNKFASKDLLMQKDIIDEINACIKRNQEIAPKLETGRI